jgi:2-haloacid dehalogenase/putative hydrolase of the HAD superfamily
VALIARHPEHASAIRAWEDRWLEMFSGPIAETEFAIEALFARGVPLFGLTNMPFEVAHKTFALSPAFGRLSDIVISGEVGLLKPDPRIFRLAAQRAGLKPEELLFIDDAAENVAAAAALGFDVHHFTAPATLGPALAARGLL